MHGQPRPIYCDQTGQEFKSIEDATRSLGIPSISIRKHLKRTGCLNGVRGYTFTEIYVPPKSDSIPGMHRIPSNGITKSQAILCNETRQVFRSINDAAKKLGISRSNLSAYLDTKGRTHAGGYTFIRVVLEFDVYFESDDGGEAE